MTHFDGDRDPSGSSAVERVAALHAEQRELAEAGRFREAIVPATEALRLLRGLVSGSRPALVADVGNAVAILAGLYEEVGEFGQAVAVFTEAVAWCGEVPGGGRPLLFLLYHLQSMQFRADDYTGGVASTGKLVELLREVTTDELEFQPVMLAGALANLAEMHDELGNPGEVVSYGAEAVFLLEGLAEQSVQHRYRLATTYLVLLARLADLGETEQAADLCEFAISAARQLVAANPADRRVLASVLETSSRRLLAAGRIDAALRTSAQAVGVCRKIADPRPGGDDRLTALVLSTFAEIRAHTGTNLPAALLAAEESVDLYRSIQQRYPFSNMESAIHSAEVVVDRIRAVVETADVDQGVLVDLLHLGPQVFNGWILTHPDTSLDLAGAVLSGLKLVGVYLAGADLAGADLSGAMLVNAVLSGADLTGADLRSADLRGAMFGRLDLIDMSIPTPLRTRIHETKLKGTLFEGAKLDHTSFQTVVLDGVDLRGCDLSTLDLRGATLARALVDEGQTGPVEPIDHPPYMVAVTWPTGTAGGSAERSPRIGHR